MIRVLLADDEALFRTGLRLLLETAPDVTVIAEADDGRAAVEACARLTPDVVLLDVRMPGLDGVDTARRLSALSTPPRILMLTTFDAETYLLPALQAGAHGFLLKDAQPGEVLDAVRNTAAGVHALSPEAVAHLVTRAAAGPPQAVPPRLPSLTPREREVLAAIGDGLSNALIGRRLGLRVPTVKAHVSRIIKKLQCENRVQAGLFAMRAGLSGEAGCTPAPPDFDLHLDHRPL
ncbi:response regulator transcription factor [Streptomyces sp. NPDC029006]|uniref:response regulator transcription factor n=1 Tax=Streptomyces sp. NPDC029006 TaxID=3155467 RepID=UPI0033DB8581